MRGFKSINKKKLPRGFKFDRISKKGKIDDGTFVADYGATFESRALPSYYNNQDIFEKIEYEVLIDIEGVVYGDAIPWFGQNITGRQYELPDEIYILLDITKQIKKTN